MVLVFGSINIDFVTRVRRFPNPGETVSGISFAVYPGGKGANQALASARAGAPTRLAGAVGRDVFADAALALLIPAGVDLGDVARLDHPTGCATILVSDDGENLIVSVLGANAFADPLTIAETLLSRSSIVSLQQELPADANDTLLRRARHNGSRVVLNASPWRGLLPGTLSGVDYLVVNETEGAALANANGWPPAPPEFALRTANAFAGLTIVVTMGAEGAIAARGTDLITVRAPDVRVIDTTGAGDAFAGTFIAALDGHASLHEALQRAVVAGSLACTAAGAQPSFPERTAVDAVLKQIRSATS